METKLYKTEDGSHTLYVPELDEHYHSTFGAVQESKHIFIETGFNAIAKDEITILEVGFGTGLNAFLTALKCKEENRRVHYITIEKYPLKPECWQALNYPSITNNNSDVLFRDIHEAEWGKDVNITKEFTIRKIHADFSTYELSELTPFDLIYFDAFSPEKQPELWNQLIFNDIYKKTLTNGVIVTYCAKGNVRRAMQASGFKMERLPGPPGKREMLRGIKKL
jgi:tRNA U34 5-methylaminomethyl-2-thiouridine-forming methyltransferase MnmC